jgi:putative ABC transport system permease protein
VVIAQIASGATNLAFPVLLASLVLVGLSIALARWLGLGVNRDIVISSVRAAVQLLAVGFILTWLFESSVATLAAFLWVVVMVAVAAFVIGRRAKAPSRRLYIVAAGIVAFTTALSLLVVFASGVFEVSPVAVVVMAGITIGNAMPSAVLGVNQAVAANRNGIGQLEAMLALGMNRSQIVRFMAPVPARNALVPQIERTKVVGLIALPGAMTGLLLAGVDPIDAVLIQILVMYLVLGATALCSIVTVTAVSRSAVTDGLVVADWVTEQT